MHRFLPLVKISIHTILSLNFKTAFGGSSVEALLFSFLQAVHLDATNGFTASVMPAAVHEKWPLRYEIIVSRVGGCQENRRVP